MTDWTAKNIADTSQMPQSRGASLTLMILALEVRVDRFYLLVRPADDEH